MTIYQSFVDHVAHHADSNPHKLAVVDGKNEVSYIELWSRTVGIYRQLESLGDLRSKPVVLAAHSNPGFIAHYLAVHLAGAIAVPLNPHAKKPFLSEILRRVKPSLILGFESQTDINSIPFINSGPDRSIVSDRIEYGVDCDGVADLLFTSGTTGNPKGVCLSHKNLVAAITHINKVIGTNNNDIEVVPVPLYHSFGLGRVRCCLSVGASIVLVSGFSLPGEILSKLESYSATALVGVPAGIELLLKFGERGLGVYSDRLKYLEIGSAAMPLESKRYLMKLLPTTKIYMHYGLTEASRSSFLEFHRDSDQLDTVGLPAPGVVMDIRSSDGASCSPMTRGVLWIKGDHVSCRYWDDPSITKETHSDGWFCTGDVAHLDSRGYLTLHARSDDMMNIGGYSLSPVEIERALERIPGISEAACVAMESSSSLKSNEIVAFVVKSKCTRRCEESEVVAELKMVLDPHKIPTRFHWVDALPKTDSGKLLRNKLRSH